MPSGPTRFDSDDGSESEPASTQPDRAQLDDRQASSSSRRTRGPNYTFRRALVVGGVVAVLATASIVVAQLVGSGSDQSTSGAVGTDWNRVVLVDERTGRVVVDDANGEELARIESGVGNPTASAVVDSTLMVAGSAGVAVIDVGDGSTDDFDLGAETIVRLAGSDLTLVGPRPDKGRAVLVHGPSGDVIDTDEFAPVVGARYEFAEARSAPSGRHVLVTDSGNFQSVLLSFDRDQPSFFFGLALAVDSELVVTAQNVGSDATISVYDHSGESISTGKTSSVRAGMITGSEVVLVTVDGAVVTMSSDGDTSEDAQLAIGTIQSGVVATSGDRLIVTGATGTALVDESGAVIATMSAQRPAFDGSSAAGATCLATIDDDEAAQIAVIDMADGSVLVEATGNMPLFADASGCVVAVTTSAGFDVLTRDGVRQFRTDDVLLAMSLDGDVAAVERDGRTILLAVGSDETLPDDDVDVGPRGRTVHFTQS